jgi:predicted nucleic acid-binding protein
LADTLLRCAEQELYGARWSAAILDEVRRNLPWSVDGAAADRRIAAMRRFFPEAEVAGYEALIDGMRNHPKDRHVLAAAVASEAEFIVTANLKDFPSAALRPLAIEALHPDDFLCDLLDQFPRELDEIIAQQADATGRHGRPKLSIDDVLDGLAGCRVLRFAQRMRAR